MQDIMERITEAEQQADLLIEEARVSARDAVAKAKAESEARISAAVLSEREESAAASERANREGAAIAQGIMDEHRDSLMQSRTQAEAKLPQAVAYLMERVEATV